MSAQVGTFRNYPNKVFVETGSYKGDGIQMALDEGFERVYSIELSKALYSLCTERFLHNDKVTVLHGKSDKELSVLLYAMPDIPITFWLDAHYSGGETVKGEEISPLLKELEVISRYPIKTHTILIDDVRDFERMGVTRDGVRKALLKINPDYKLEYIDGGDGFGGIFLRDILVARP